MKHSESRDIVVHCFILQHQFHPSSLALTFCLSKPVTFAECAVLALISCTDVSANTVEGRERNQTCQRS